MQPSRLALLLLGCWQNGHSEPAVQVESCGQRPYLVAYCAAQKGKDHNADELTQQRHDKGLAGDGLQVVEADAFAESALAGCVDP
jgi:hypothetical protein